MGFLTFLLPLTVVILAACSSKTKTPDYGLLPFKDVPLTEMQAMMVDGCSRTIDPRKEMLPETRRNMCACTVMNQDKMFKPETSAGNGDEQTKSLAAPQDLCRCAVGIKPAALKTCEVK